MFFPSSNEQIDPSLAELLQYSSQAALKKQAERSHYPASPAPISPGPRLPDGDIAHHASREPCLSDISLNTPTLSPMRERDLEALAEWFTKDDIGEIEADIILSLLYRTPEPCWEDNPFSFLNEYL